MICLHCLGYRNLYQTIQSSSHPTVPPLASSSETPCSDPSLTPHFTLATPSSSIRVNRLILCLPVPKPLRPPLQPLNFLTHLDLASVLEPSTNKLTNHNKTNCISKNLKSLHTRVKALHISQMGISCSRVYNLASASPGVLVMFFPLAFIIQNPSVLCVSFAMALFK